MFAAFGGTAVVLLFTGIVLGFGRPPIDPTANALRPRHSQAYGTLDEIQAQLNQKGEPLWLIVSGNTIAEVGQRLDRVQAALRTAVSNQVLVNFTLPTVLWPRPENEKANEPVARHLVAEKQLLAQAAQASGFAPASLGLANQVLDTWQRASATLGVFWPTNPMSQWILQKVTARSDSHYFALGLLTPATKGQGAAAMARLAELEDRLPHQGVLLSGWQLLGNAIFSRVKANMWKVLGPMVVLVLGSLYFAFRRPPEIVLSLAVLCLSGLVLLAVMSLAKWQWNLLNLMAIPLVLGTGVDYSIFMQLALRRFHGDLELAYNSVGRALLLCGGTAIAGFGSLAWSSNAGMASLGQVCAVGIGSNMLIAIFLLPLWWHKVLGSRTRRERAKLASPDSATHAELDVPVSTPSSLYRSEFWRLGIWAVRLLPPKACVQLAAWAVRAYWVLARHRREVVVGNLLPAVHGDKRTAQEKARALFQQFALKLLDLWRVEAGLRADDLLGRTSGWEHFVAAQEQKRGVLLLTPHLGNWEFGGPLMTQRGVTLQVLTSAEPGAEFTELRRASRARWNIETLVVGSDPMAFVEVIRRLESGATVALLIDRPPPPTAVTVELFGRPFPASIAAAELARASGCVLLPVYLARDGQRYEAHILPPVAYDRSTLRAREARQQLTQTIMSIFEPLIRDHLDQWYHFVPLWPAQDGQKVNDR